MSLYRLSDLKRYNNMPRIKSESLAEHQYYCGLILIKLKDYITNIDYSQFCVLLQYLLVHDVGELYTGDIPHNVKQDYPELRTMIEKIEDDYIKHHGFEFLVDYVESNEDLKTLFKLCDTIQVVQYCQNEMKLGNKTDIMFKIKNHALDLINSQVKLLKKHEVLSKQFNIKEFLKDLC